MGITRSKSNVTVVVDEVAPELDVETLGRQRPEVFSSTWMEVAFVGSMLISLAMGVSNLEQAVGLWVFFVNCQLIRIRTFSSEASRLCSQDSSDP